MSGLTAVFQLAKVRLSAVVTLSAATGYLLFGEAISYDLPLAMGGVFLLSCGANALNHLQDRRYDARMPRTRARPLPSGRVDPAVVLFVAGTALLLGFSCLATITHHMERVLVLGGLSLFWYNGVYTYLKRVTAFAVIPGALIGAVPPLIGWAAAGGTYTDPLILLVTFFFFIWQIPHFWLLMLFRGDEYVRAGLPSLTRTFNRAQICRLTFMWIMATATAGVLVAGFGRLDMPWNIAVLVGSVWIACAGAQVLYPALPEQCFRTAFAKLILYAMLVMAALSLSARV
jgi:protoheme IX farnesyltransferase